MSKLIVGCGYLGHRVARRWVEAGHPVWAVTRSPARAAELEKEGLRPVLADVARPDTLAALPAAEAVLYAVAYNKNQPGSRRAVYVEGLRAVLDALASKPRRVIFTSSTGVYGQTDGSWVDEDSPCRPGREGGRVMLEAEDVLRSHRLRSCGIVLRLAGIYGPDRIPRLADLLAGRPIPASPGGSLNLIHVDDAAEIVLAADARARSPRTYLASDGHPTTRRAFYECLAKLLQLPGPEFTERSPEDPSSQRGGTNKRASNARMLADLGVSLQFPSYREGLRAIVAAGGE